MVDAETSTVFATLSFGVCIFAGIFVAFEFFRSKFLDIFIPNVRRGLFDDSTTNVEPPNAFPGSWIMQIWKYSDDDILDIAGMDAYVYLRFLKMCFKITLLVSIFSSALLAVYGTAVNDDDDVVGINHYSLANIPSGNVRLWAPFLFTYLYTFIFLYYIYKEYENFTMKRAYYLKTGDIFIPKQTQYSILIENIPSKYRSPEALKMFFNSLFPDEVLHAYIAISLGPLDTAVAYRDQLLAALENNIALYEASGKTKRPKLNITNLQHLQKHVFCCDCCSCFSSNPSEDDEEEQMKKNKTRNHLTSSDMIVDAIDYLSDQIAILSEEISIMQLEALKAEEELNKDTSSSIRTSINMAETDDYFELVEAAGSKQPPANAERRRSSTARRSTDAILPIEVNPMLLKNTIKEASMKLRDSIQDIKNIDKALLNTLQDYKEKITKKMISATGFITFKSRRTQAIASQLPFLSEDYPLIKVIAAPPPTDIIWDNMSASTDHIESISFLTTIMYYTGLLFWSVILTFIAAISNLSDLETYLPFLSSLDTTSYAFLQGILPVIVMIIFLSLIPITMAMISTYVERRKTYSDVQQEVFKWYFMYQIANVYLTLLAGSAFTSINDVLDNPTSILNYISAALPSTSVFFINYCITQLFISLPLLSLQLNQLVYYLIIRLFYNEKQLTRRMIIKDILSNVTIEYGTSLPDSLYILTIALLYWVIAPIVIIICTAIFGATYVLLKYQYLYIYTRKYESGGKYWYGLYYYSMLALLASTITIIAYMSIKEAVTQAPLFLPLPFIIFFFWRYTEGRFKALSENIPYSAATKVDLSQLRKDENDREYQSFTWDYLKQPSLTAPKYIRPYPYRINGVKLISDDGLVDPIYFPDPVDEDGDKDDDADEELGGGLEENFNQKISLERRTLSNSRRSSSNGNGRSSAAAAAAVNNPITYQASSPTIPEETSVKSGSMSSTPSATSGTTTSTPKKNYYIPPMFLPSKNKKK